MGKRKLTRVLVEAGVGREVRNNQGETPGDIARRKGMREVEGLLVVDRLEEPLREIISDLEAGERRRGRKGTEERRKGRRGAGRGKEEAQVCDCGPMLERLGEKIEQERGEILKHIRYSVVIFINISFFAIILPSVEGCSFNCNMSPQNTL